MSLDDVIKGVALPPHPGGLAAPAGSSAAGGAPPPPPPADVPQAAAAVVHAWTALASLVGRGPGEGLDALYDQALAAVPSPLSAPPLEALARVAEEMPPARFGAMMASLRPDQRERVHLLALQLSDSLHRAAAAAVPGVKALRMLLSGYLPAVARQPENDTIGTPGVLAKDYSQLEQLATMIRPDAANPAVQAVRRQAAAAAAKAATTRTALIVTVVVLAVLVVVFLALWLVARGKGGGGLTGGHHMTATAFGGRLAAVPRRPAAPVPRSSASSPHPISSTGDSLFSATVPPARGVARF